MTAVNGTKEREGCIDLHAHTTESDGSNSPEELVRLAVAAGLRALAVTDHDTFSGYEKAVPFAQASGLELVRGIELNSRLDLPGGRQRYVHLLAYFPAGEPGRRFIEALREQQEDRRERNRRLIDSLQERGVEIDLEEVEAVGKSLTGRPHFAKVLVSRGYASDADDAFQRYLGEGAPTFVERQSPSAEEVIGSVREGNGLPVVAHPIRLNLPHDDLERDTFIRLKNAGLIGLEVCHSEQAAEMQEYYGRLADELELLPTGGSDYHGVIKPDIRLGSGRDGNVRVPADYLEQLRATALALV